MEISIKINTLLRSKKLITRNVTEPLGEKLIVSMVTVAIYIDLTNLTQYDITFDLFNLGV